MVSSAPARLASTTAPAAEYMISMSPPSKRLHGFGARADVEQLHVGAKFLIQSGILANPKDRKGAGEGGVGDAELGCLGVGMGTHPNEQNKTTMSKSGFPLGFIAAPENLAIGFR